MDKTNSILKKLNLRPTKQRTAIIDALIVEGDTHVTASSLGKILEKNRQISLLLVMLPNKS